VALTGRDGLTRQLNENQQIFSHQVAHIKEYRPCQARKANKKARQSANSSDESCDNAAPSDPCKHIKLPDNCTLKDFKDAHKLWNDFLEKMSD
jgi:hypothetical protein